MLGPSPNSYTTPYESSGTISGGRNEIGLGHIGHTTTHNHFDLRGGVVLDNRAMEKFVDQLEDYQRGKRRYGRGGKYAGRQTPGGIGIARPGRPARPPFVSIRTPKGSESSPKNRTISLPSPRRGESGTGGPPMPQRQGMT